MLDFLSQFIPRLGSRLPPEGILIRKYTHMAISMFTPMSNQKTPISLLTTISFFAALASAPVSAACKGADCACVPSEIQFKSPVLAPGEHGKYPISLEADEVEADGTDILTL